MHVVLKVYSVSQKSSLHKTFGNIFTQAKYVSVKFCQFVASLYPHTYLLALVDLF